MKNLDYLLTRKTIKARYEVKKLIAEEKRNYFETKLTENIGKRKELWKTLKALGLPNKVSIATINVLKDDKVVKYDLKLPAPQTYMVLIQ